MRNKPYWKESVAATIKETKTLILADWAAQNWSGGKHRLVIERLVELLNAGFNIYAWQSGQIEEINKDNIAQLLKEQPFIQTQSGCLNSNTGQDESSYYWLYRY